MFVLTPLFICSFGTVAAAETGADIETNESEEVAWTSMYEGNDYDGSNDSGWSYQTHLRGDQVVPEVITATMGDAGLSFDEHGGIWHWLYVWKGSRVTEASLHCGYWGDTGPIVAPLFKSDGLDVSGQVSIGPLDNRGIDSSANCKSIIGFDIQDTDDLIVAIKSGAIYIEVNSRQHPDGLIRGQFAGDPYDPGTGQNNYYDDSENVVGEGTGGTESPADAPPSPPENTTGGNVPSIVERTAFEVRSTLRTVR